MPLGTVGEVELCIGVLDFVGDRQRKGAVWGLEISVEADYG